MLNDEFEDVVVSHPFMDTVGRYFLGAVMGFLIAMIVFADKLIK